MAIAKMKKLTLLARKKCRSEILKSLQRLGAVHITEGKTDEDLFCSINGEPAEIEQKLSDVRNALEFLKKYDKSKKSLLTAKPAITLEKLENIAQDERKADNVISKLRSIDERLVSLHAQKTRIYNKISSLKPYINLDMPLEMVRDTRKTKSFIGVVNANAQSVLDNLFDTYNGLVYVEKLEYIMDYLSVFIVAHESVASDVLNTLKTAYFSEFSVGDYTGTPKDIINAFMQELDKADQQIAKTEEEAAGQVEQKNLLKKLEDYYIVELERAKALDLISGTEKTFMLEGWVIAGNEQRVEKAVADITGAYYIDFRDPYEDENYPVALLNKWPFKPFEAVIEMYSLPDPRGVDATVLLAPFYFIFYGMMVSDAGYGIILTIFALLMLKIQKPGGMFRKILGIISMTGISTLIWGSLYGGWFGFSLPPLWFNPMNNAMMMLILVLALGFVHVLTGLIIGAVLAFKKGKWVDAVCDKIIWIILLVGLPMIAFGGTLSTVGSYMAMAGAAGVILTNGRGKKGIIKKLIGGLAALYGSTGYLSDVLSYSRLFGMGLATGVIAMVFNTIAGLLTGTVIGWIFAAAVFLVGHIFNIGINALGAYVHSCRLMYIEYFSKFYEDGGKPYKPLAFKIKNYRLENETLARR